MIRFLDPRAPQARAPEPYALGLDLRSAQTPRLGLLANGFPDSEAFLQALDDALAALLPGLVTRHWNKGNASISAPEAMVAEIRDQCDALVAAYGH